MSLSRFSIPTPTRAPDGSTNAYLLGDLDAPALLVDPAGRIPALDTAVSERPIGHVAVTHTHPDHVGAVAEYARKTGATVWARRGHESRFTRATGVAPDRLFSEDTVVPVAGGVRVLDTPGHARDHVAFESPQGILCGDLAVDLGSVAVTAPEGDMRAYLIALRRLYVRSPTALYPGHGPVIERAGRTLERLVRHRRRREFRVERAVADGASTPDEIVDVAYEKDVSGVRDLARATVVAHLEKLAVEGRVRWDRSTETAAPQ